MFYLYLFQQHQLLTKVTRDNMMIELDKIYPEYGYAKHKGYPTKAHIEASKKIWSKKLL